MIERGRGSLLVLALSIGLGLIAGCDRRPRALSPSSLEDPARAALARDEADKVRQANREAEAAFHRRARTTRVLPEVDPVHEVAPGTNPGQTSFEKTVMHQP